MKKIIYIFIILCSCGAYAQVDRTIGTSQYKPSNFSKPEKKDPIERTLAYLKETLNLDGFQEAAVKSYLIENLNESEKMNNLLSNPEEKRKKFDELKKVFDEKTILILNPEQIKIFEKLGEKSKEKSKKNKRKKEED